MKNLIRFRWLFIAVCLFSFLQYYSLYHFYYIEQEQMFLFLKFYILDLLLQPGGFAKLISEGLVQFFMIPYAGAIINTLMLLGIGMVSERILKQLLPDKGVFWVSLFSVLASLMPLFDISYRFQGLVAYLMMLFVLWGCMSIKDRKKRLLVSIACVPFLYFLTGPVSVLFAVCLLLLEILKRTPGSYQFALPLVLTSLISILVVFFSIEGDYRFSFLPDAYYHSYLHPKMSVYLPWIALPVVVIISFLSAKIKISGKKKLAVVCFQIVLLAVCARMGVTTYSDQKMAMLEKLDYFARTEQWDKIKLCCKGEINNYICTNYLNMALARQGVLGEQIFNYDQQDANSIMVRWDETAPMSIMMSEIYFAMGCIANSQWMAFEGLVATQGYANPRLLKRLVETNLIIGAYHVAEKYIFQLEHTFYYREWATAHRKFLYNDKQVEQDSLLGPLRKGISSPNRMIIVEGILAEMEKLAVANPQRRAPMDYLLSFCLLCKDINKFSEIVGKYYGTPVLPSLSVPFQEALIIIHERNMDSWEKLGISESVGMRFIDYKNTVKQYQNCSDIASALKGTYGKTYWFFYMFK